MDSKELISRGAQLSNFLIALADRKPRIVKVPTAAIRERRHVLQIPGAPQETR
jgi:hypothetical protein